MTKVKQYILTKVIHNAILGRYRKYFGVPKDNLQCHKCGAVLNIGEIIVSKPRNRPSVLTKHYHPICAERVNLI
jgi:hypothetical protein